MNHNSTVTNVLSVPNILLWNLPTHIPYPKRNPLRVVYIPVEGNHLPPVSLLISVPKKRFKRAVKRNRVKRQIREAFRTNKQILTEPLANTGTKLAIAFIWLDNELHASEEVDLKVRKLLQLITERLP